VCCSSPAAASTAAREASAPLTSGSPDRGFSASAAGAAAAAAAAAVDTAQSYAAVAAAVEDAAHSYTASQVRGRRPENLPVDLIHVPPTLHPACV